MTDIFTQYNVKNTTMNIIYPFEFSKQHCEEFIRKVKSDGSLYEYEIIEATK